MGQVQQGQKGCQGHKAGQLVGQALQGGGLRPSQKAVDGNLPQDRAKLAKDNMYAKELLEISETTGVLVVSLCSSIFGFVSSCHS